MVSPRPLAPAIDGIPGMPGIGGVGAAGGSVQAAVPNGVVDGVVTDVGGATQLCGTDIWPIRPARPSPAVTAAFSIPSSPAAGGPAGEMNSGINPSPRAGGIITSTESYCNEFKSANALVMAGLINAGLT
jgi:hypothetical protein